MSLKIVTARLELIASTDDLAQAKIRDRAQFARLLGAVIPQDWPPPFNDAASMQYNADCLQEAPDQAGWRAWYLLKLDPANQERHLIGVAGFVGPPSANGEVEVGYSLVESYQGMGYGTEAVEAMMDWAFVHPQVMRIVAYTLPELAASIRLLKKIGFTFIGPGVEEGTIRFELERQNYSNDY